MSHCSCSPSQMLALPVLYRSEQILLILKQFFVLHPGDERAWVTGVGRAGGRVPCAAWGAWAPALRAAGVPP